MRCLRLFESWFGSPSGLLALLLTFSIVAQAENVEHDEILNIEEKPQKDIPQQSQKDSLSQLQTDYVPQNEWTNVEHEDILTIQAGGSWLQDQYLSPLLYDGFNVGIGNEWWQGFRGKKNRDNGKTRESKIHSILGGVGETSGTSIVGDSRSTVEDSLCGKKKYVGRWEHVGKVGLQLNVLQNSPRSNQIYALGLSAGWGAYYTWKWPKMGNLDGNRSKSCFQIGIGPYIAFDFMPRYILSNVNKPYSMDIAADVDAMAFVSYSFGGKKTSYRLRYLIRTNLIGVDFMPDYWESYYEITEGIAGKTRCAGMWNHRYLNHELTLDMQFKHSTWRVGVRHEYLEYGEKNMWFSREQVSAVIGTCFRYRTKGNHRLTEW